MMNQVDLSRFNNTWYKPGGNLTKRILWYLTNLIFFNSGFPINGIKVFLLRLYGSKVGKAVVIKPWVSIKYPWKLKLGSDVWIGERVWIDNLGDVTIGDNVCLSQGALLLCGNHDYKKPTFDLLVGDIILEEGVWIGANATVCPSVTCFSHSVLSVGSVATSDLEAYKVYQGNPAEMLRERIIQQ